MEEIKKRGYWAVFKDIWLEGWWYTICYPLSCYSLYPLWRGIKNLITGSYHLILVIILTICAILFRLVICVLSPVSTMCVQEVEYRYEVRMNDWRNNNEL